MAKINNEEIFQTFQSLRNQQRNLVNNLSTLEFDLKEHKTVIDTLKTVDEDRKCFRLIGGVLCEQTVKAVLPQLNTNKEQLEKLIENGKDQLGKKGLEINLFKETHNIRIKGSDDKDPVKEPVKESSNKSQNVLVV